MLSNTSLLMIFFLYDYKNAYNFLLQPATSRETPSVLFEVRLYNKKNIINTCKTSSCFLNCIDARRESLHLQRHAQSRVVAPSQVH